MAQKPILKCRGLYTFPNLYSELPEGALIEAENVVVDRESVISPRRGFGLYGDALDGVTTRRSKQLLTYKGRVLRHYASILEYDSNGTGTFSEFAFTLSGTTTSASAVVTGLSSTQLLEAGMRVAGAGIPLAASILSVDSGTQITLSANATASATVTLTFTYPITEVETGLRIKAIEANSNLYFTTDEGIKKISAVNAAGLASARISDSGGIKALDGTAVLNSQPGFFAQNSVIAYRWVWGIEDANKNLILGEPSERIVVSNDLSVSLVSDFNTLLDSLDTAAPINLTKLGDTTNSSSNITNLSTTADLAVGMTVTGSGIPVSTSIVSIVDDNEITINTLATLTASGVSLTFIDSLSDTDYNSLKISPNSSASTIWTALTALCSKLDNDLGGTDYDDMATADFPTEPEEDTVTNFVEMQEFYDAIVDRLLAEGAEDINNDAQTAGDFLNSVESATTTVTTTVPDHVTTAHFYQLYRTPLTTGQIGVLSDLDPGDEMQLAYEGNPTSAEIASKTISIHDITPESFLGANLYTNANSGDGIIQSNAAPPLAKDIAVFKNTVFYANTETKHKKQISLLSATDLTNRTIVIGLNGGSTLTYTFRDTVKTTQITCVAGADLSKDPTPSDYFDIYTANDGLHYRIWFNVDGINAAPAGGSGISLLEVEVFSTDTDDQVAEKLAAAIEALDDFDASAASGVVTVVNTLSGTSTNPTENVADTDFVITIPSGKTGAGEDSSTRQVGVSAAATPAQAVDETARSLVRIINKQASSPVIASYVSGPSDVPGSILLEAKELGTDFFYLQAGDATVSVKFNPAIPTSGTTERSDNEVSPNRIYFSKYQQPEAVPVLNFVDVGPKDEEILRIVPLRDSLFVLKQDGIYRLSGDRGSFSVTLFDSSTALVAADSASVLNNQIYMFADQGIVTVSDTGVSIISRPIENLLLPLMQFTNFETATFSAAYESDRAFLLWTVERSVDTVAAQCFRYNTFTSTWTRWDSSKTCAVVNKGDDKLYLGASDVNYIEQERKSFSRLDYADRATDFTMPVNTMEDAELFMGDTFDIETSDVIVQTQYLTIAQFVRLLAKLDDDPGVDDDNYEELLTPEHGAQLAASLQLLVAKLNADPGIAASDFTASGNPDFATMQTEFNAIVTKLNSDTGAVFINYPSSSGTVNYEALVTNVINGTKRIFLNNATAFIAGPMVAYAHIESIVIWAPQHFGDPSVLKQIRESTIMFEDSQFTNATAAYSTDLSTGFERIPFNGEGTGTFGANQFGEFTWGGMGTATPFRTYIPIQKQRCRAINCKFTHKGAFQKYSIFGISFTYEMLSSRGYR